ncbi:PilZ domain-containing protein [Halalkalibacter akibai]|uniref:PilZ domain-containing protein n=1 Tax=Halalkalibacter akibai (strain ATCC 43226 / DSM 21942 / CIP 109018 / JCM 9157 / 1139) TaxID=1236973 RepID=W4QZC1_HALA3|nr:PilZ domain-containing protein [Halalkalibacter akibai]GAE37475.1 hypothetical protein JCM9157_4777 [Halalkalibacter akibai JCM 9157]
MLKRYNRNESFRYEFGQPIKCDIYYEQITDGDRKIKSNAQTGAVINMSPKGLQIHLSTDFLEQNRVKEIECQVKLSSEDILTLNGQIVWRKAYLNGYLYGVFLGDENMEQVIIQELKKYSKSLLNQ